LSQKEIVDKENRELSCKLAVQNEIDKIQRSLLVIDQSKSQAPLQLKEAKALESPAQSECEGLVEKTVSENQAQIEQI
jgi:hypothetical protein